MQMRLQSKDILGLQNLTAEEILHIVDVAKEMKVILHHPQKKASHLSGKSVITVFYENSTRTRMSFELATKYLGGTASNVTATTSSAAKGESLIDTVRTIDRMGTDVIILRHPFSGAPHLIAKHVNASVINAGDGSHEHPTQALLDIFTIIEKRGHIKGLQVTILGDILHSRVARSNIWGLTKLGAKVSVAGPSTLMPKGLERLGVSVYNSIAEALTDADVVMGLRIQTERQNSGLFPSTREYAKLYGIDDRQIQLAKKDALLLHPGPVNRGLELTSSVIDGKQSLIEEQVTNGVAIRMALLYLLTRREQE